MKKHNSQQQQRQPYAPSQVPSRAHGNTSTSSGSLKGAGNQSQMRQNRQPKDLFQRIQEKWKFIAGLIIAFVIGRAILMKSEDKSSRNSNNATLQNQEYSQTDFSVRNIYGDKNYYIGERLKIQAHRNFKKYVNKSESEIDEYWRDKVVIAERIAKLFQEFSQVDMDIPIHFEGRSSYRQPHLSLINDPQYCKKSNQFHLTHPASIRDNYLIFTDFGQDELPREAVQDFGVDMLPRISQQMERQEASSRKTAIPTDISMIYSRISRMHHYHKFNDNLFCTFQSANHVPGKWSITGKDLVIDNFRKYTEKEFQNTQKCIEQIIFMPESYRLYDKSECQAFFRYLDSEQYKKTILHEGIQFILKEGRDIHRGEGIKLISPKNQKKLQEDYNYGKNCGANKEVQQIQRYINNPILHKGKKLEVRIYFLIASTSPLIVYTQKLALLKKCAGVYDKFNYSIETHVCNTSISKSITDDFVVEFALDGLQEYLLETGFTTNENWLEEIIYPQIYRAITHLVRAGRHDFLLDSRVYESFAVDFLIDDSSKVWFMENNPNPQLLRSSVKRTMRHMTMFGDQFEIQFAYLRSRADRLQNLGRKIAEEILQNGEKFDRQKAKKEFDQASKNFIDEKFKNDIRENSTYVKIYDETLLGKEAFMGYLPEDCLDKN